MKANGTILDILPIGRALGIGGGLLVALFTLVKPEASNGLGMAGRGVFWLLHVGLGLGALWIASRWLASGERLPNGTLASVLVTGCAGILIAAPGYYILDILYAGYIVDLDADPDQSSLSIPAVLFGEVLELTPWFMTAWVLINLPVLLPRPIPQVGMDDSVEQTEVALQPVALDSDNSPAPGADPSLQSEELGQSRVDEIPSRLTGSASNTFLQSLPGVVGSDIVAVSSDLHYLNVWTTAGRTTLLGNLRDVAGELGETGMQVHRSHWVAHSHVRRIVGTASNAACILSNELRVPISRRRWKAVREHYGRGVVKTNN